MRISLTSLHLRICFFTLARHRILRSFLVFLFLYTSRSSSFSKLYISCTNLLLIPRYFVALQHQLQHFSSFILGQSVLYLFRLYLKIHLIYLLLAANPTHFIYLYLCGPLRNYILVLYCIDPKTKEKRKYLNL